MVSLSSSLLAEASVDDEGGGDDDVEGGSDLSALDAIRSDPEPNLSGPDFRMTGQCCVCLLKDFELIDMDK